ncbi:MAG: hypothetical protein ACEPOZ_03925 [Marinifilaceae bacterium]
MRELSVPIPIPDNNKVAEVEVKLADGTLSYQYRMESFDWDVANEFDESDPLSEKLLKIHKLKTAIQNYSKDWELIQIYTPHENSKTIQVLFRKR